MNNLLSQSMGQGLDNMANAFQAVLALLLLPAYWVLLAALGAFLYFLSRRQRVEPVHDIRLRVDPALTQSAREHGASQRRALFNKRSADSQQEKESQENTASVQSKGSAFQRRDPLSEGAEQGLLANPGGSQEGLPPISIHDAPLLVLSGASVLGLAFLLTLLTASTGDPLTRLLGGGTAKGGLMRFLLPSERNSFIPMIMYTVLGGVLLAVLPLLYKRFMSLEWVHTEPTSQRTRRLRHLWRSACMVDFHRLDGSVETWLTPLLPVYVILLFFADVSSFYLSLSMPPAIMAAAHLLPVSLVRLFGPVWGMRVRWERKERDIQQRIPVGSLVDHLWQNQFLGTLLVKPASNAQGKPDQAPALPIDTAAASADGTTPPVASDAPGGIGTEKTASEAKSVDATPPPPPREDLPPLIKHLVLPATNPVSLHDTDLPTRLEHGLALLQRRDLAPFLAHALRHLFQESCSVVLSGPQGSGRTEVLLLCALEAALRGGSTLLVVNDRRQAQRLLEDLAWLGGEYPAFRLVHVHAADSTAMRHLEERSLLLDILVVDLASQDAISGKHQGLDTFWSRLDLVIMPEVDEASPLTRLELPYLLSRITALSAREPNRLPVLASVLASAWKEHGDLSFMLQRPHVEIPLGAALAARLTLVPLKPLRLRVEDLADEEALRRLQLVDPLVDQALDPVLEPDGKPVLTGTPASPPDGTAGEKDAVPEQLVRRAVQEQDLLPIFAAALSEAGYPRFYLSASTHPAQPAPRQDMAQWSRRARDFARDEVVLSLVCLRPETFFRQLAEIRELSQSCAGGRHLCFIMPPVDGQEEALHQQIVPLLKRQSDMLAPVLYQAWTNTLLEGKHLLGAIADGVREEKRLRDCFGDLAIDGLLERAHAGQVPVEHLDADALRPARFVARPARTSQADNQTAMSRPVAGALDVQPVRVVCRELGLEGLMDKQRQPSVLYPGRIFSLEGQRVRVAGQPQNGLLVCVPEALDKSTTKIRKVVVRGDQDISLAEDHIFNSHGIGILHTQVDVREQIIGCRTWSWFREEPLQESLYGAGNEVRADYRAHAAVIFLPGVTEQKAHLFAHMLKRYLKLVTGDTADQLDVAHGCFEPFSKGVQDYMYRDVTVLDSVPGGSGLCQLVTPDLLRRLAAHLKALHESGARWSHIRDCQAIQRVHFSGVDPMAEGPSLDTATDLVDFLETMLLTPEDRNIDAIDYSCNLWTPGPRQDSLPGYSAPNRATSEQVSEAYSAEAEDAPMRELLWRVHADVNRLRPLESQLSDKETP